MQDVVVGPDEAFDFAPLLGKRFDHADAGDGVGQHAGQLGPGPAAMLKSALQMVAHAMHQPTDERQRQQGERRQRRIHFEQHAGGHDDHQDVAGEIEKIDRQKETDPVGVAAQSRDQITRPLAAEKLERQLLQMGESRGPQIAGNPFGDPGQHVGSPPTEQPGRDGGCPPCPPDTRERRQSRLPGRSWCGTSTLSINGMVKYVGIKPAAVLLTDSTKPSTTMPACRRANLHSRINDETVGTTGHGGAGGAFGLLGQERHPAAGANDRRVFVPVRLGFT